MSDTSRFVWKRGDLVFKPHEPTPDTKLSEFFKEWAHNNVPGKKGFQSGSTVPKPPQDVEDRAVRDWTGRLYDDDLNPPYVVDNHREIRNALANPYEDQDKLGVQQFKRDGETLLASIANSEPTTQELYRGIRLTDDEFNRYVSMRPGDVIPMNLSSWTPKVGEAQDFATKYAKYTQSMWQKAPVGLDNPVIFTLQPGARALPVGNRTPIPREGEHLSAGRFEVRDLYDGPNGIVYITVRQVGLFTSSDDTAETFREWAHNNVAGKKGFQSKSAGDDIGAKFDNLTTELYQQTKATREGFGVNADEHGALLTKDGRVYTLKPRVPLPGEQSSRSMTMDGIPDEDIKGARVVHTHPSSGMECFSPQDIAVGWYQDMPEIRVLTAKHEYRLTYASLSHLGISRYSKGEQCGLIIRHLMNEYDRLGAMLSTGAYRHYGTLEKQADAAYTDIIRKATGELGWKFEVKDL